MEVWKKNLIALGLLITVCTGIYLNWLYSSKQNTPDFVSTLNAENIDEGQVDVMNENGADTTVTNYFAAVRMSRQQARDSAVTLLQETMATGDLTGAAGSSAQLEEIVQTALIESQIESLVIAKGYADCVAYLSDSGISVAVASPEGGLQRSDVALIADVVMSQSDVALEDIHVVDVP